MSTQIFDINRGGPQMRRCRVRMLVALTVPSYAVALTVPSMRPDVRHTARPRRRPNAGRLPRMALGDESEQLSSRWCSADRRGFLRAGPASVMLGGLFGLYVQPEQSAEPTPLLRTRAASVAAAADLPSVLVLPQSMLLRTLPQRSDELRFLQAKFEDLNVLRAYDYGVLARVSNTTWQYVELKMVEAGRKLDQARAQGLFMPAFRKQMVSQEQISRGVRAETAVRQCQDAIDAVVVTARSAQADPMVGLKAQEAAFGAQVAGLQALADLGDLMIRDYPYALPSKEMPGGRAVKRIPLLLGRAEVVMTIRRAVAGGPAVAVAVAMAPVGAAGTSADANNMTSTSGIRVDPPYLSAPGPLEKVNVSKHTGSGGGDDNDEGSGKIGGRSGGKSFGLGNPSGGATNANNNANNNVGGLETITITLDGYGAPVSAGNFVDLVKRGFYDKLTVRIKPIDADDGGGSGSSTKQALEQIVLGAYDEGFIDPVTGKQRRVPLEVLREDPQSPSNKTLVYTAARNSAIFTKAKAVASFKIPGAVGVCHPQNDGNGGSSDIFIVRTTPDVASQGRLISEAARLDSRWALFGYVTQGIAVATSLAEGDVIESARVVSGLEHFVKPAFNLMDVFFPE